jgi:predicted dinucleotide-binding enzyme
LRSPRHCGAGIVILAVPHDVIDEAVQGVAGWGGRIVPGATNAIDLSAFTPRARAAVPPA